MFMRGIIKKIKYFMQNILCDIVSLIPKNKRFVLRGFPDYEDNLLAIYEELMDMGLKDVIWVIDNVGEKPPIDLGGYTKLVKRGGFCDFYYSCTSKYLFITHGHFLTSVPKNQVCVNLWHGIPFKQVGIQQGMIKRTDTYLTCTSEFTKKILHESFKMPKEKIHITGQPRTDRMIRVNKDEVVNILFCDKKVPNFIFIWLPTYRQTHYLKGKLDGRDFGNIFNCSDFSLIEFNAILQKYNAFCLVKPHPMAPPPKGVDESHIIFIDEKWLVRRRTSLYQLIGIADCLISDISSVIADFTLLDKPIILLFEDIDEYKNSRGFSFNPITDFLPAKVMRNFEEFIDEVKQVLDGRDMQKERRKKIKNLFFEYCDEYSAKRVLDLVLTQNNSFTN